MHKNTKGETILDNALNDATLQQMGDIYQYLIALKDCFQLRPGETLQIELSGDVSIVNQEGGRFQKEVKHHLGKKNLSDRDVDFWKTLANWYVEYERIKSFSCLILSTTAGVSDKSSFVGWNELKKEDKLGILKTIGKEKRKKEKTFRTEYERIFNKTYEEEKLLDILDKVTIFLSQTSIVEISKLFTNEVRHIPVMHKDHYIGDLLGQIVLKVKEPPHRWEVTSEEFDQMVRFQTAKYVDDGKRPLPLEYAQSELPTEKASQLLQKKFVREIREIDFEDEIPDAMSDYWKTDMTVLHYFQNEPAYLDSIDLYKTDLTRNMKYSKKAKGIKAKTKEEKMEQSQLLYIETMKWPARDFGSIIGNQDFFQRGVIHNIVNETDFKWKIGGNKD